MWRVKQPLLHLHLPTEHPGTLELHPAFPESRFSIKAGVVSSRKGSVGQGQQLPQGACHIQMHVKQRAWLRLEQGSQWPAPASAPRSLVLGTPWKTPTLGHSGGTVGEKDSSSPVGVEWAENEKEVSNSTEGTEVIP